MLLRLATLTITLEKRDNPHAGFMGQSRGYTEDRALDSKDCKELSESGRGYWCNPGNNNHIQMHRITVLVHLYQKLCARKRSKLWVQMKTEKGTLAIKSRQPKWSVKMSFCIVRSNFVKFKKKKKNKVTISTTYHQYLKHLAIKYSLSK